MNIIFKDKKLGKIANDDRKMQKELGAKRAKVFRLRLFHLSEAENLAVLRSFPGNHHELKYDRKGQWACDLDNPYRLIYKPQEDPIPKDEQGSYIWCEIKGIEIIKIVNYHKEK